MPNGAINTFQTQFWYNGGHSNPYHSLHNPLTANAQESHYAYHNAYPLGHPLLCTTCACLRSHNPKDKYIPLCHRKNALQVHNWPQNLVTYCIVQDLHPWFVVHVKNARNSFLQTLGDSHRLCPQNFVLLRNAHGALTHKHLQMVVQVCRC